MAVCTSFSDGRYAYVNETARRGAILELLEHD
jgi:hypothetical protein